MTPVISSILVTFLGFSCIFILFNAYLNKDKSIIWSPITFIVLTILYYWVMPEYFSSREFEGYNVSQYSLYFHIGAILSFFSILFGFYKIKPIKPTNWNNWNNYFTIKNVKKIGVIFFMIALACYIPFRGFHFSIFVSDNNLQEFEYENVGLDYYFVNSIAILCFACCLLLLHWKKNKLLFGIILWLTLVTFIVAGFRYRIVILVISMLSVYHLYNGIKKIKLIPLVLIALLCYTGFNIMDKARNYGNGIRLDLIKTMDKKELTEQAAETERVYNYSIMVMNGYAESGHRVYFEPLLTAICIPIPRSIFPWKPDANYMREATTNIAMKQGGSASVYVNFVEAFMAFGWIGIVINGLFIGFLSRKFWDNYRNNPNSIGAILALSLYNGLTYVIISRGYLAQEFSCFLYYIIVPFLLSSFLVKKIKI